MNLQSAVVFLSYTSQNFSEDIRKVITIHPDSSFLQNHNFGTLLIIKMHDSPLFSHLLESKRLSVDTSRIIQGDQRCVLD